MDRSRTRKKHAVVRVHHNVDSLQRSSQSNVTSAPNRSLHGSPCLQSTAICVRGQTMPERLKLGSPACLLSKGFCANSHQGTTGCTGRTGPVHDCIISCSSCPRSHRRWPTEKQRDPGNKPSEPHGYLHSRGCMHRIVFRTTSALSVGEK